jgi:hypothetical protein
MVCTLNVYWKEEKKNRRKKGGKERRKVERREGRERGRENGFANVQSLLLAALPRTPAREVGGRNSFIQG